ncbi:Apoptosis regulator bax [Plakobranchus ocellatus]|uniref:Apoptosis regulator bax n=1 Tax=Plakobranchus ocellatus TaxID=259542 RepID=A0AAV4ANL2_9GAST|nr:Apoptosis regulator bax [Plakobranchus ocellatus]
MWDVGGENKGLGRGGKESYKSINNIVTSLVEYSGSVITIASIKLFSNSPRISLVGTSVDNDCSVPISAKGDDSEPLYPNLAAAEERDRMDSEQELDGGQLFELFVSDQISKNKVTSPRLKEFFLRHVEKTKKICDLAVRLCDLATTFSQTEERQKVKEAALTVSKDVMKQELNVILSSMMSESANIDEGIIILLFFCLDLSERILETEHEKVWEVMTWCRRGIDIAIGPYVQSHGGWTAVGRTLVTGYSLLTHLRSLVSY